jgi:signal transduction histidine kinase
LESRLFLSVTRDVTARKIAEKELIEARHSAEKASRIKSEFLANMSHEIRTPLNGILGMLQLLQTSCLNEEQSRIISMAIQSSARLTHLLSDILEISHIESGMIAMQRESFSIQQTLVQLIDLFMPSAELHGGIKLTTILDSNLPSSVIGDSLRLLQVLTNLLSNAFKFTKSDQLKLKLMF